MFKALKRNGRNGNVKYSSVDLPLNKQSFKKYFVTKVPALRLEMNHVRGKISVNDLKKILGNDCNVLRQKSSSTQQRIVGEIDVYFRPKIINVYTNEHCGRYFKKIYFHISMYVIVY